MISRQELHNDSIEAMLWLTKIIVRPARATSPILPRHFFWNAASPTASTSDKTDHFARHHVEAYSPQPPHWALALLPSSVTSATRDHRAGEPHRCGGRTHDALAQRAVRLDAPDAVALGEVVNPDYRLH